MEEHEYKVVDLDLWLMNQCLGGPWKRPPTPDEAAKNLEVALNTELMNKAMELLLKGGE